MSNVRSHPHIKICGLRDEATIAAMDGLPITEVGLVFAPSKRQVTIEQGAKLAEAIKKLRGRDGKAPQAAGVFVNYELAEMKQLLSIVPLDIVQLHGQESIAYVQELKQLYSQLKIWKVVSIKPEQELEQPSLSKQLAFQIIDELKLFAPYIDAVLLDAPGGGTGKPFNWKAIDAYQQALAKLGKQLIVAGGLHEDNVGELLNQYAVDGVDVSSGVESNGIKDINKIKRFVRKVIEA